MGMIHTASCCVRAQSTFVYKAGSVWAMFPTEHTQHESYLKQPLFPDTSLCFKYCLVAHIWRIIKRKAKPPRLSCAIHMCSGNACLPYATGDVHVAALACLRCLMVWTDRVWPWQAHHPAGDGDDLCPVFTLMHYYMPLCYALSKAAAPCLQHWCVFSVDPWIWNQNEHQRLQCDMHRSWFSFLRRGGSLESCI